MRENRDAEERRARGASEVKPIWHTLWAEVRWDVRPRPWRPPTDVFETEDALVVRVEVAGMRPGDFEVTLQQQILRIHGVRYEPQGARAYYQMEIPFGEFEVLVHLPFQAQEQDAEAEYRAGFLLVRIRKTRPVRVRVSHTDADRSPHSL